MNNFNNQKNQEKQLMNENTNTFIVRVVQFVNLNKFVTQQFLNLL